MQSVVLSLESVSSVYAAVIPVRPLFPPLRHSFCQVYRYPYIKLCLQLSSAPRVRRELYSTHSNHNDDSRLITIRDYK